MRGGFAGIQGLRALAALAVAFLHISDEAGALVGTPGHSPYPVIDAVPLEAGVDLFFVISGFVMVWASWDAFGRWRSIGPFVWRRLLRILPLYWLLTAVTAGAAFAVPGAVSDGLRDGWGYVMASFAFLPWHRADGFVQPVLRLGWTLEYEMLFYALVACALPLRRPAALTAILAALAALVVTGQSGGQFGTITAVPLAFWTDPVVAEFALGVLVAVAARRGWRAGSVGLLGIAAAMALAWWFRGDASRVLVRGGPAMLLVFCALSWNRLPGWLMMLGNSSYALYLVHPFPMRALRVVFAKLPGPAMVPLYLAAALATSVMLAVALHVMVEQPILRRARARQAVRGVPATRETLPGPYAP